MFRKEVKIPVKLLDKANNLGFLGSLAYFVKMKALYKNCTMYRFNYRDLADALDCSTSTAHKHLTVLNSEGLIRFHSDKKNLTFLGHKAITKLPGIGRSRLIKIDVTTDIKLILKAALLRENIQSQDHNAGKREKEEFNKQKGIRKRKSSKPETSPSYCDYTGLSIPGIAGLYSSPRKNGKTIHYATALRLKKKLAKAGLIVCEHKYKVIHENFTQEMFNAYRDLTNDYSLLFFKKAGQVTKRAHDKISMGMLKERAQTTNS